MKARVVPYRDGGHPLRGFRDRQRPGIGPARPTDLAPVPDVEAVDDVLTVRTTAAVAAGSVRMLPVPHRSWMATLARAACSRRGARRPDRAASMSRSRRSSDGRRVSTTVRRRIAPFLRTTGEIWHEMPNDIEASTAGRWTATGTPGASRRWPAAGAGRSPDLHLPGVERPGRLELRHDGRRPGGGRGPAPAAGPRASTRAGSRRGRMGGPEGCVRRVAIDQCLVRLTLERCFTHAREP